MRAGHRGSRPEAAVTPGTTQALAGRRQESAPRTQTDGFAGLRALHGHFGGIEALKSDGVVAAIERLILRGDLPPGARLPTEQELCDMLGVSRSVVRDAVRTLAGRGLVSVRQGRGMTVSEPDDTAYGQALGRVLARSDVTIGDVMRARMAVESQLMPLIVQSITDDEIAALTQTLAQLRAAADERRPDDARDAHLTFHLELIDAVHLPALVLMLRPFQEVIVASAATPDEGDPQYWEVASHADILATVRARDVDGAVRAMAAHFEVIESDRYGRFADLPFRSTVDEFSWLRSAADRARESGRSASRRARR